MCLASFSVGKSQAQFVRLTMEVQSELKAVTIRQLDFGTVEQSSGEISVSLDEENAGIFAISGNPSQYVLVRLTASDTLYHADRSIRDNIPLNIEAAYANRGAERVEDAQLFANNTALFSLFENASGLSSNVSQPDVTAFIYIFGKIIVGDIETGIYSGDIILQVEYL